MSEYSITKTAKTPEIRLDMVSGLLEIKGRSIPEDPQKFYAPLMEALRIYSTSSLKRFEVTISLEYFNSTSSKCIYNIMKKLDGIKKTGCPVFVKWLYEEGDEDVEEAGEGYQKIFDLSVEMIPVDKKGNRV